VLAFAGWGDAGEASTGAVEHLIETLPGGAIGSIDPDTFYEFQARRPLVEVTGEGQRTISWPSNEFHALHLPDHDLVAFLGEEPHLRWRAFSELISESFQQLGVRRVVTMGAFLGQVAHTRPVPLVGVASIPSLLTNHGLSFSDYQGPTGIVGVVTNHLISLGMEVISIWAAVPHYLANQNYPPAVQALLAKMAEVTGLDLDLDPLGEASSDFRLTVDAAIKESDDVAEYVRRLEEATVEPEPETARRLVEEIERFLRDR
jgi:proteasome assembly chaperone (PAC2) family protein